MQENQNFDKHACQNTVAMETSNCLDQNMSYQIPGGGDSHIKVTGVLVGFFESDP